MNKNILHRWNSCAKKIPYRRKIRAERALKRMKKVGYEMKYLQIYECRLCGYYHLGNKK